MERPPPLVPRHHRFTVPERIAADGSVLLPLDEAALDALAPVLVAERIEAVVIGFIHSYANPDHERRARDRLARALPGMAITQSAEVCPEIREYDRLSTACANAYLCRSSVTPAVVGVPLITPVCASMLNPAGSVGDTENWGDFTTG